MPRSTSTSTTTQDTNHEKTLDLFSLVCLPECTLVCTGAPKLLLDGGHCLAVGKQDWLGLAHSGATALSLGYLFDTKSYPGQRVLFVVDYSDTAGHGGKVFTIFVSERSGRQIFDIQNNAKFIESKKGIGEIDFVEPPLGGTGTQEDLAAAIRRIDREPRFTVPVKDLLAPSAVTHCTSYADKK
jgi:hypothetical protein